MALLTLARPEIRARCRPLFLGHLSALKAIADSLGLAVDLEAVTTSEDGFSRPASAPLAVLELENPLPKEPRGTPSAAFGAAAVEAVLRAGSLAMAGQADGILTPPLHKTSMHMAGFPFEGQTQILGELSGAKRWGMLACSGELRIWLATRHMALTEAIGKLNVRLVLDALRGAHHVARDVFGKEKPRVALAGLNPHAGENGAFGDEESRILKPAIARAWEEHGITVAGPLVPDVVFADALAGEWDVVVALYHDQAFIPLKMLGRNQAWTVLAAGKILRVSPMHGTACDLVGTGQADPSPFAYALDRLLDCCASRIADPCSNSSTTATATS